jgi:hypothetical protein
MFSRSQKSFGPGLRDDGRDEQTLQDGRQIETTIEPILDLGKITMCVLGEVEGMVRVLSSGRP